MKITSWVHGYPPVHCAGAEMTIHAINKFLASQGHTVSVITGHNMLDGKSEANLDGVNVYCVKSKDFIDNLISDSDILITHLDCTKEACNYAKKFSVPVVHLIHNPHQLAYHKVTTNEADLVVYNAISVAAAVRFPAPSMVVYPPVFLKDYQGDFSLDRSKYTLINMNENKGAPIFWFLADEEPNREFLGVTGSYGEQIIRKNPKSNVTILPHTNDMKSVYEQTHVLLMPSASETWGRTAIEAASNGVPVIANPTPGLVEAMGKDNAIWANRNKIDEWLKAIEFLDDKDNYMEYSIRGFERAKELERISEIQLKALEYAMYSVAHQNRSRIYAFASTEQYLDHLAPVMHSLDPEYQGITTIYNNGFTDFSKLEAKAYSHNLVIFPQAGRAVSDFKVIKQIITKKTDVLLSALLVAAPRDKVVAINNDFFVDRMIHIEHGSGQTYMDIKAPYLKDFIATLGPGQVWARNLAMENPTAQIGIIGCPKLDWAKYRRFKQSDKLTVAISFRYKGTESQCAELGSAFEHFRADFEKFIPKHPEIRFIGHGHPFAIDSLGPWWQRLGVKVVTNFENILDQADILMVDNSSVAFEWKLAHKSRPLILMNSPEYRKYINHGLRFWDLQKVPGVYNLAPGELSSNTFNLPQTVEPVNLSSVYGEELGWASLRARECLMACLNEPGVESDLVQIKFTRHIDYGRMMRMSGEVAWFPATEAHSLVKLGHAENITRKNPEVLRHLEEVDLSLKQDWDVNSFARYFQLVVPKIPVKENNGT